MNTADRNKIIDRMKKILALSQDAGATDGERAAAIHQLQNMMARHNIDMATVEGHDLTKQQVMEGHTMEQHEFYGRPWANTIVHGVSKMLFCTYFVRPSTKKNMSIHCFCGTPENVAAAVMLARFLVEGVLSEGTRQARIQAPGHESAWRRSFGTGASSKLYSRCMDEMKKPPENMSAGTALVLTSLYQKAQETNTMVLQEKYGIRLRARTDGRKKSAMGDALSAGNAHGAKMNLGRNLGA